MSTQLRRPLTLARRIAGSVRRSPKALWRGWRAMLAQRRIEHNWPDLRPARKPHGLPAPLMVSLTSYPPRFASLAPTLKCLLSQTIAADSVVLWIAEQDLALLPPDVKTLVPYGLRIETTSDLRSFKKIIPALERYPESFIAIADDDAYYPQTWLEELVHGWDSARREIICHRAHRIRIGADGAPLPYRQWIYDVADEESSPLLFPTGIGGVLYPPDALHPEVLDQAAFQSLCPSADDIWLYWMALRNGYRVRRVGPRREMLTWPRTQGVSLHRVNASVRGANDIQIRNMLARYGFPAAST